MKTSRASVDAFLRERSLAVIGVSRTEREFSQVVYRLMKERGYTAFPVNPFTQRIDGDECYPNIRALPAPVNAALVLLPKDKSEPVVRELVAAGVRHIWIQQGADTPAAVDFCRQEGVNVVAGECIMMFLEPLAVPHRVHRWMRKVTRSLPV